jgi:molecular chaperone IbpA
MKNTTLTYTNNALNSMLDDLFMIGFGTQQGKPRVTPGFPFYNVIKIDEDTFGIEIALAGYERKDVEITEHNSSLLIKGTKEEAPGDYLHQGISNRNFTRSFALAEHVHVQSAKMENGLLQIILKREVPEEKKPKQIVIES